MSSLADWQAVAVPNGAAHGLSESERSPSKLGVLETTEDLSRAVRQPGAIHSPIGHSEFCSDSDREREIERRCFAEVSWIIWQYKEDSVSHTWQ